MRRTARPEEADDEEDEEDEEPATLEFDDSDPEGPDLCGSG